jgi:predicted nucleic acid-binding protein
VTVFIDTTVFMYAAGADHPLKQPCRIILERAATRQLDAATSAEVVQEILLRFVAIRRASIGVAIAREVLESFDPVLPISHRVVARVPDLVERYPALAARDLIHVATCLEEGIGTIVTPDRGFDGIAEIGRLAPEDASA